jgi:hypothetical protein
VARDATTEPGIGTSAENMALKRENMRLRRERNEARQALSQALTRFGKLKLVGKWAILGTVVGLLAPVIEHYVPEYAAVIHELVKAFGS